MRISLSSLLFVLTCGCAAESVPTELAGNATATAPADQEGFVPLSYADFELFTPPTERGELSFQPEGQSLVLVGDRRGYLHTRKSYRDFTLRFEFRWPRGAELPESEQPDANTGALLFIEEPHRIWPRCLEVQGKWSELGQIKSNARDVTVTVREEEALRLQARKPVGEWNAIEIVAKGGALTSYVNGVKIAESDPTELRAGPIGLQAERYDVEFRNVRIREE
jgi:hypothetical protein